MQSRALIRTTCREICHLCTNHDEKGRLDVFKTLPPRAGIGHPVACTFRVQSCLRPVHRTNSPAGGLLRLRRAVPRPRGKARFEITGEPGDRTPLREAARQPANFAGHYVLTTWARGTGCVLGAAVDLKVREGCFSAGVGLLLGHSRLPDNFEPVEFQLQNPPRYPERDDQRKRPGRSALF